MQKKPLPTLKLLNLTFGTSYGALDIDLSNPCLYLARLLRNLKSKPKWPVNLGPVNLNLVTHFEGM